MGLATWCSFIALYVCSSRRTYALPRLCTRSFRTETGLPMGDMLVYHHVRCRRTLGSLLAHRRSAWCLSIGCVLVYGATWKRTQYFTVADERLCTRAVRHLRCWRIYCRTHGGLQVYSSWQVYERAVPVGLLLPLHRCCVRCYSAKKKRHGLGPRSGALTSFTSRRRRQNFKFRSSRAV